MFKCTVCDITANSENDLLQHLRGRLHLRGLERKAISEKSVYIRGFPTEACQDSLNLFINKSLGEVKNLWISKSVPPYALVEFNKADDALKALQTPKILFNGAKLEIKPRRLRPVKKPVSHEGEGPVEVEASEVAGGSAGINWDAILQSPSADCQLQSLSENMALPLNAVKERLVITFHLLQLMRPSFPRCIVTPFGSTISGLGTRTSDCDISFFTNPPASLVVLLNGSRYFSDFSLSIVKKLEDEYGITFCPPRAASSLASASQLAKDNVGKSSPSDKRTWAIFYQIATLLKEDCNMCKVYTIAKARCPIISFVHSPTAISCDISVDSYLGVLNTRLMKAYCEFDERVVVLVRVLKHWVREHGFPRAQLNSYTLSLMMIYALQRCSPPVLPCLQSPGPWPRNFQKHPILENNVDSKLVHPLNVIFTSPKSLKPSKNNQGTANLLLHFFKFYATIFDSNQHAVCVRSNSVFTKLFVATNASKMFGNSKKKILQFFEPLMVQDPFDLSHNVARALHPSMLRSFQKKCLLTANKLQDELAQTPKANSLKSLFANMDEMLSSSSTSSTHKIYLSFSPVEVSKFLHCSTYQSLVDRLEELDWTSMKVQRYLGKLLLAEVVQLLLLKFGFICEGNMDEQEPFMDMEELENEVTITERREDHEEAGMELQAEPVDPVTSSERKRKRSWSDQSVEGETAAEELSKRSRAEGFGPGALDLLYSHLEERHYPDSYTCTALSKSWVNTRRARREVLHQQQEEISSSPSVVVDSLQQETSSSEAMEVSPSTVPSASPNETSAGPSLVEEPDDMLTSSSGVPGPVLQLSIGLAPTNTTDSVTLQATALQGEATDFYTLFVVLKKLIKH